MSRGCRPALVGLRGPVPTPGELDLLRRYRPAGVLLFARNLSHRTALRALVRAVVRTLREAGVTEPLVATDHEGGAVSALDPVVEAGPSAATLGLADDPAWTARIHYERGRALRECGVNLVLAPVADVDRPLNPVIGTRAFGRDRGRVCRHVDAAVRGLHAAGIRTCPKHWPGHGSTTSDSHLTLPSLLEGESGRWAVDHPPFVAAVRAGARAVMVAHLRAPRAWGGAPGPLSARSEAIARLREELSFDGLVVADALEMAGYGDRGAGAALAAGCDLVLLARPVERCVEALGEMDLRPDPVWPEPSGPVPTACSRAWPVVEEGGPAPAVPAGWELIDLASADRLLRVPGEDLDLAPDPASAPRRFSSLFGAPASGPARGLAAVAVRPVDPAAVERVRAAEREGGFRVSALFGAFALDERLGPPPDGVRRLRSPELRPANLRRILREWKERAGAEET